MGCGLGAVRLPDASSTAIDVPLELYRLGATLSNRGDQAIGIAGYNGMDVIPPLREEGIDDAVYYEARTIEEDTAPFSGGLVHTRYATAGSSELENSQPFYIDGENTLLVAHNGNVPNAGTLREQHDFSYQTENSDTEVLARIIADESEVRDGIQRLEEQTQGAYSLVMMDDEGTVYGYRDTEGYRPLWYTVAGDSRGNRHYLMSETVATGAIKLYSDLWEDGAVEQAGSRSVMYAEDGEGGVRDLRPGELIVLDGDGATVEQLLEPAGSSEEVPRSGRNFCSFEDVYFQQPPSLVPVNGGIVPVGDVRYEIGRRQGENEDIVQEAIVVPVLASGKYFGRGFADATDFEYVEGLHRARTERVFMDAQGRATDRKLSRKEKARLKHIPIPDKLEGEVVTLLDDSIVRGTTSSVLVNRVRDAGAEEVHVRIGYPRIQSPCLFGVDHSERENLFAVDDTGGLRTEEEMAEDLGAASLRFVAQDELAAILDNRCFKCTQPPEEYGWIPGEARPQFEV